MSGNRITNGVDICGSKCIHNDAIQGWNWEDKLGVTNKNVVIDSNFIQSQTTTSLPLASTDLQGSRSSTASGRTFPSPTMSF
jgi:hypothetical protein